MKLKTKIICLPALSLIFLVAIFLILIWIEKGRIDVGVTGGEALDNLFWYAIAAGVGTLFITTIVAGVIAKRIVTPIAKISSIAEEIARGDLSSAVGSVGKLVEAIRSDRAFQTDDEAWRSLIAVAAMTENLNSLVGQVQKSGIQVASSSTQLFSAAKHQEVMVTTQMDSVNRVHESIDEVSHITARLVDTIHQVASLSQGTADIASNGQSGIVRMQETMHGMEDASKSMSDRLEAINEKADTITTVVTTITKVAEQTNLLSLNASIEAEKAGEWGKGFSVIAREIRRLADQTAVAALDIEGMVQEMQSVVAVGVMEMDKFFAKMRYGVQDVDTISTQLTRIIDQVQQLSPNFENVKDAMGNQSQKAGKIDNAIGELSQDMDHTVASLRESFSAIKQLNTAVNELQKEVSKFQVSSSILLDMGIIQPFSDEAKSDLNQKMQGHHFSANETIIRQGDPTDSLYIIAEGVVGISVEMPDGNSIEVARKSAGDFFGEIALLTGEPRTATVFAITDVYVFEIRKDDIAPYIKADPEIAERLTAILTKNMMDTEAKKSRYEANKIDGETFYRETLKKIQRLFGTTSTT
ncbi:MAG: cyclic nucleotide-binding domain-containing protein [Deltaproteobacteria bacterium]|nr:cyclic nucleotide-binding domain-containing protein [Deltaproteobacteria bacterium]